MLSYLYHLFNLYTLEMVFYGNQLKFYKNYKTTNTWTNILWLIIAMRNQHICMRHAHFLNTKLNMYYKHFFHTFPRQRSININAYFLSMPFVYLPNEYFSSHTLNITIRDYFLIPRPLVIFEPRVIRPRYLICCILTHFQEPIHSNT